MKRLAVGFSGLSNSGKTTLIQRLIKNLSDKNFKVITIKHDPKDKAVFDTKGKDSYKFYEAGSDVVLMGESKCAFFYQNALNFDDIISKIGEFDYLFLEGLKSKKLPRICVIKDENLSDDEFDMRVFNDEISSLKDVKFDYTISQIQEIIDWIDKFGKKL